MTDPLDNNDDWAELAREFALDKPAPVREEPSEPAPLLEDTRAGAAPDGAEDEFEDGEEAAAGEPGGEGDGAGGTGRKRRRRRRRRRKGGAPGEGLLGAGVAAQEDGEEAEAPEEAGDAEPVAEADDSHPSDRDESDDADDFDSEPAPLTAEEDTASDVLRELIATWNVPSWDSIVSGLYRPS